MKIFNFLILFLYSIDAFASIGKNSTITDNSTDIESRVPRSNELSAPNRAVRWSLIQAQIETYWSKLKFCPEHGDGKLMLTENCSRCEYLPLFNLFCRLHSWFHQFWAWQLYTKTLRNRNTTDGIDHGLVGLYYSRYL